MAFMAALRALMVSQNPASSSTMAAVMRREAVWSVLPWVPVMIGRAALAERSP